MVPEANLGLMTPGEKDSGDKKTEGEKSPREVLTDTIDKVREFHEAIEKKYKTPTYAHYGAQGKRDKDKERGGVLGSGLMASKNLFTWGEVAWEGEGVSKMTPGQILIADDDGNGELKTTSGIKLSIGEPDCPGDGTVPLPSGEAPGKAGIALSFAHGHGNPGKCNEHFSYDHQGSYGDKHGRSLYASMYAIIKIAQQAQWHKK